jgi:cysteine desulfurase
MHGTGMHYLDANATQPLRPDALEAITAALATTGNPSSVHQAGRVARRIMEDARDVIAARFSARPQDVVFTSGGTEADAIAIHALAPGRRLIISAIEHDAVRAAAHEPVILPVGADGVADLQALEMLLRDGVPSLVCLMLANNETGVIQPVQQAAVICRRHAALLHVDAVQGGGRLDVSLPVLGANSLAISSHKLGGPAGVGALLLAPDTPFAAPLTGGGGQERGRRGGTQPVALIAGFAAAAVASQSDDLARVARLRDAAEQTALAAGAVICGDPGNRLPNTTCLGLPGVRADAQVIALDLEQIAVSAGAACSSGKVAQSHVLRAMGLGALAGQSIRISLPWNVSQQDVDAFAVAYLRMAARLRSPLVPHAA